ncbi:hypothetical protein HDU67_001444, partial [Dinochytrium kinnereticum]
HATQVRELTGKLEESCRRCEEALERNKTLEDVNREREERVLELNRTVDRLIKETDEMREKYLKERRRVGDVAVEVAGLLNQK